MSREREKSPAERKYEIPEHPDKDLGIRYPYIPTDDMDDWSDNRSDWLWPDGSLSDLSDYGTCFIEL
jgi:hypothetical protein